MLRVHFTAEDLARTVVSAVPDPMWEIVLSRFRLHDRHRDITFRPWAARLRQSSGPALRSAGDALRVLAPRGPYFPDFLTPAESDTGLAGGLRAVRDTPPHEVRAQLRTLARHTRLPGWARSAADGTTTAMTGVTDLLRAYHDAVIAPSADLIEQSVAADHAHRTRAFATGGLAGLFASLRPSVRWRPPVLEIDYMLDRDLHLRGRGLRLVPSYFCTPPRPVALADDALPPVLVYPMAQQFRWQPVAGRKPGSLDALLGRTRGAVLRAVTAGATTTQLARTLDTSVSSVSRHTAVLRDAGLITSHRHDSAVLHTHTALGSAMLAADQT